MFKLYRIFEIDFNLLYRFAVCKMMVHRFENKKIKNKIHGNIMMKKTVCEGNTTK